MNIRSFTRADTSQVVTLWAECELVVAWNDPLKDIERKLSIQPELFLVGTLDDDIIASVMAGYDGHRGWINYLAVSPRHRGQHYARQILAEVESSLQVLGCPKINLQVRSGNRKVIEFYEHLGFGQDNVVSMGKRLIPDS